MLNNLPNDTIETPALQAFHLNGAIVFVSF
jgi:hypothetical protein